MGLIGSGTIHGSTRLTLALLTRVQIEDALRRLGELALHHGETIELLAVGGVVMVLAYDARLATHDVDAILLQPELSYFVRGLVKQIADELEWPPDWLNDGAKGFLTGLSDGGVIYAAPGIIVSCPAPEQLLAMKLSAWRDDVDIQDARRLLQELAGVAVRIRKHSGPWWSHLLCRASSSWRAMHFSICGSLSMTTIEQIAAAVLQDDNLETRSLVQDFLRSQPVLADIPQPDADNPTLLVVAAALLELFSLRTEQPAPEWTGRIGPMEQPLYLLKSAAHMRRLRDLCRDAAPEPLRRRRLYAPPNYLTFA